MNWHYRDEFVFPGCSGKEQIVLPRQSPLGISEGQQYLTTPFWPAVFVCFQHAQLFSHPHAKPHLENLQVLAPNSPPSAVWEIAFRCDRENCGRQHRIWLAYSTAEIYSGVTYSENEVRDLLAASSAVVPCVSHGLFLSDFALTATIEKYPK